MGHSAIMCDESKKNNGNFLPSLDLLLDGKKMDIRSITGSGYYGGALLAKNQQIGKYNNRKDIDSPSDSVCLYFHDKSLFSEQKMNKSINYYKHFRKNDGTLVTQRIKHVFCVINGEKEILVFDIK